MDDQLKAARALLTGHHATLQAVAPGLGDAVRLVLAAAPEPLRVAGEEVERLRCEIERLEADATVEDIVVAGLKPERDKFDAGERSNLNTRFVRGALDAEANAKRWRQMASDLRSVLALIDARPPASEEVEKAAAWLEETVADYCDPDSAFRAAELLRRLALIEPSAGGGDRLVPVRVNDEWPFPMPVPPPVQDLRYGMYLNLRDMVRAAYRRRHLDPRLGHFIETNYADYLATFDEIDLALSPTPDQPKQEVKDV